MGWKHLLVLPALFACSAAAVLYLTVGRAAAPFVGALSMLVQPSPVSQYSGQDLMQAVEQAEDDVISIEDFTPPREGDVYGRITIENTPVYETPVLYGDAARQLNQGVGTYTGGQLPGMGSTVLLAGHTNTAFAGIEDAEIGDLITLETYYGVYTYRITDQRVHRYDDETAYDLSAPSENLTLYTCYPFGTLGLTELRYFVYADYVSGPVIDHTRGGGQ